MRFYRLKKRWTEFWMGLSGTGVISGLATRLATWYVPPYYGQVRLAELNDRGFRSPSAVIHHSGFHQGLNCYIGDDVLIYQDKTGGEVRLEDAVYLHRGTIIQTGGGSVRIGAETHIHPRCQFSAYKGSITIGARVEIAPNCAFYPYNHGMEAGIPIREQPLFSRGGIVIGDDAWLGYGVIVLDGARIGTGAVIGAGSVVTGAIPDQSIAVGTPAKVVRMRG